MIKTLLILLIALILLLNILSVAEMIIFNKARILAINEIINFGTWILLPDKESKSNQKIGN